MTPHATIDNFADHPCFCKIIGILIIHLIYQVLRHYSDLPYPVDFTPQKNSKESTVRLKSSNFLHLDTWIVWCSCNNVISSKKIQFDTIVDTDFSLT